MISTVFRHFPFLMLDTLRRIRRKRSHRSAAGPPLDFQHHLRLLEERGLLTRIDRVIDKDSELHPLVRWQFQGGLAEEQRRAFLFTNVVDGSGRCYDIPVAVGALGASPAIYAVGMGKPVDDIGDAWTRAYRCANSASRCLDRCMPGKL